MKKNLLTAFLYLIAVLCLEAQNIFLQEDFSTSSGSTPPAGWTVQTATGDPAIDVWRFDNPGRRSPAEPIAGKFACFDSDKLSNNTQAEIVYLISPEFNATSNEPIILKFDQYFLAGYEANCIVEVFDGTSWISIYSNNLSSDNPQKSAFDITSIVHNKTNVRVRFKWTGNYGWYWIVDNVVVYSQSPSEQLFQENSIFDFAGVTHGSGVWGDFDNDGDLDFIVAGYNQTYDTLPIIYRNNSDGSFSEAMVSLPENSQAYVKAGWKDFDNDGLLDLIIKNLYKTTVFYNDDENNFTKTVDLAQQDNGLSSFELGDFNNDGASDISLIGFNSRFAGVFRNKGYDFSFQKDINLIQLHSGSILSCDYNNDGDLDLLLTGTEPYGSVISKLYKNDSLSFNDAAVYFAGIMHGALAWGDYDNDGNPDLFITGEINNAGDKFSGLYHNYGNSNFTEESKGIFNKVSNGSANWGDFNNDGLIDILLTGSNSAKIYENTGNGSFLERSDIILDNVSESSGEWGDYDNDGDLDILITGYNNHIGITSIYTNNNLKKNSKPTVPDGVSAILKDKKLRISWNKASDNETPAPGLTYNLRIGTTPGGSEILSPASLPSGRLTVPDFGNTWHNTSWVIDLSGYSPLPEKIYYAVQTVDNGFLGSDWSPEKSEISNFVADFSPYQACQAAKIRFQNQSFSVQYPITACKWQFNEDGKITVSTEENPVYTFSTSGMHQVSLTITNANNETISFSRNIEVIASPDANFSADPVCHGTPTVFKNNSQTNGLTITSWEWDLGDKQISSLQNPTDHFYAQPGSYFVKLKVTSQNGCSDTISKKIVVGEHPVVILSANGPLEFCSGNNVKLSVGKKDTYLYQWKISDTPITDSTSSKMTVFKSGEYSVTVNNSVANCISNSPKTSIIVTDKPGNPVIQNISDVSGICEGGSTAVDFQLQQSSSLYTYQWKRDGTPIDNATGTSLSKVSYSGNYTVSASVRGCSSESDPITLNFIKSPVKPIIHVQGPVVWYMAASNDSAVMYKWYRNDALIEGSDRYIYMANKTMGTYKVSIANKAGCVTMSDEVTIPVSKGQMTKFSIPADFLRAENIDPFVNLKIYPNPTPGMFTVEMDNNIYGELVIDIFNQGGSKILNIKFEKTTSHFRSQVDLSGQAKGMYVLNFILSKYFATRKLLVE